MDYPEYVIKIGEGQIFVKPEPVSYPAAFNAIMENSSTIKLNWNDAGGMNPPDGYLIKTNQAGNFSDPVD